MSVIKYESYERNVKVEKVVTFKDDIKSISVSYDGGRFYLYLNEEEIYTNSLAGNNFLVEFTKD